MENKEETFKKGTVYKNAGKFGLSVHSSRTARNHSHTTESLQAKKTEDNCWVRFNRDMAYDGLVCTVDSQEISGENLKNMVEEKLFYNILDENCLGALSQDDISIKYCKGRLPTSIEKFVDIILSCPVIDDDDL